MLTIQTYCFMCVTNGKKHTTGGLPVKRISDASKTVKSPESEPTRAHDEGNVGDASEIGLPVPADRGEQARIPLDLLDDNPDQPRQYVDPDYIEELAATILQR